MKVFFQFSLLNCQVDKVISMAKARKKDNNGMILGLEKMKWLL